MALGDQDDMIRRLRAVLPLRWFADMAPVLDGVLAGLAWVWSWVFGLVTFARAQTRLASATGGFLDMIAQDYFGTRIMRRAGQADASFRTRLSLELLRERGTRPALVGVLTELTGRAPLVFEPARPADTGGYGAGGVGYGSGGGWGSLAMPFQCFVTAYRPTGNGIAHVPGYGSGGWDLDVSAYGSLAMARGGIADADIYAAVAGVMPVAAIAWTSIVD